MLAQMDQEGEMEMDSLITLRIGLSCLMAGKSYGYIFSSTIIYLITKLTKSIKVSTASHFSSGTDL